MNRLTLTTTETMHRTWARAVRCGMLASVVVAAAQAQGWEVDPSCAWYDPMGSHHYKHATLGSGIGFLTFEASATVTDSRLARYAWGIGTAAAVGIEYEQYHASRYTLKDPADAAWTAFGGIIGSALADATNEVISASFTKTSAAISATFRW